MANISASSKRFIITGGVILALVAAASIGLAAWRNQPKGIIVAISSLPDSLNPILEQNLSGMNASELVFDGLVNFEVDMESGSLYPELALAESIEQDTKDKKTYQVLLRQVVWHDGNPLTAEDVVFSFEAYMDEKNRSPKRAYLSSFIKEVRALSTNTVEIEFHNPIPPFRAYPVLSFKIIPAVYNGTRLDRDLRSGEHERSFSTAPNGTGPFRVAEWEIGKWLSLEVNGTYFKGIPKSSSIVLKRMIDPVIRMNELKKGRINLILETSPMDRSKVAGMSGIDINSYLPWAYYSVAVNNRIFPNEKARKALSMALDRPSLVPSITDQEYGVVLNHSPLPSDIFTRNIPEYINETLPDFLPHDPDSARSYARESGLSGKTVILIYPDSMGEFGGRLAEGIARQMASIGVEVETKRTGDQVFKRMVYSEKSYELALLYNEGFDNVFSELGRLYRSDGDLNVTGIADRELDRLFDAWEEAVVMTDWVEITLKLNKRLSALAPSMALCSLEKDVYSRGIKNVAIATDNPFLSAEHWVLGY